MVRSSLQRSPLRPLTSPPALRAYLTTVLAILTALALLFLSSIAYIIFYYNYVPSAFVEKDIPLQYTFSPDSLLTSPSIHALVPLHGEIRPDQPYDVHVLLEVPTSDHNSHLGNFMVSASVFSTTPSSSEGSNTKVLEVSKTGLLTYRSPMITTLRTLFLSPAYLLNLAKEAEIIDVPLLQSISFPSPPLSPSDQKWHHHLSPPTQPYPSSIHLSIHTPFTLTPLGGHQPHLLRIYTAKLRFVAKLKGLRWAMYHHRILSFLTFAGIFFFVMAWATAVVWWRIVAYLERKVGVELGAVTAPTDPSAPGVEQKDKLPEVDETTSDDDEDLDQDGDRAFDGRRIKREPSSPELSDPIIPRRGSKPRISLTPGKKSTTTSSFASSSRPSSSRAPKSDSDSPTTIRHTPTSTTYSGKSRRASEVDEEVQTDSVLVVETMEMDTDSSSERDLLAARGGYLTPEATPAPESYGGGSGGEAEDEKEGGVLGVSGSFRREGGARRRSGGGGN
ncbi:hypothetical protein BJ508DRAFT_360369 [Ascobolus immersus RN42]|uniref:Adipose-regulatory protein-domain-containing protein n=1 Tax=Ascobolus immersus RN42 TaxID=1160509 RepID=A0A3N4IHR8_ASCIM|nr:hypothetical protein BJ508DRAFT_360369 [Ascobolus immersus RN42]